MKVLIVEDNEDSRNLLAKQLSAYGHEVTAAVDGVDALEKALESPPDILVTDILMPRMDGYKLCYEWKRNKRLQNIPFVFYTAIYTSSEDEKFALNLGANLFIRKPIEPEALAKILSQAFEQAAEGLLTTVEAPPKPSLYLSEYNERLVAKLNEKVAELERSEAALAKAEKEKSTILNSLSELLVFQDLEHRIIWANKAAGESVGMSPGRLVGRYCYEVWGERSETCPGCPLTNVHQMGKPQSGEMTTPDGRMWQVRGYPVRNADGDMSGVVEAALDITESKQAEEALRESEAFRSGLLANSPTPINVINPDSSIRYVNPALERLTGFSAGELIDQKAPYPYWPKEGIDKIMKGFRKAMRQGSDKEEHLYRRKNGERFWVEITSTPVKEKGKSQYLLSSWVDITERKRAEEALRESEARYRAVIEGAHDMIQSVGLDGSIIFVNKSWLDTLGYTEAELSTLNLFDIIHPDSREHCRALMAEVVKGKPVEGIETVFLTKDGRRVLVEGNAAPRYIGDRVVATQGIFRDVTERKLKEKDYQNIIHTTTDGFWIVDSAGRFLDVNNAYCALIGYSREELLNMSIRDIEAVDKPEDVAQRIRRITKTGHDRFETRHRRKDDRIVDIEISTTYAGAEDGRFFVFIRDITERKRAEEEIARLARFPNENPAPVMRIAQDGTVLYANKATLPLLKEWKCQVGQILPKYWRDFTSNVLRSGSKRDVEVGVDKRILNLTFTPIAGEGYVNLYGLDVTERKRAEGALRESEEKFKGLAESITDIFFAFDKDLRYTYWNKASEELTGIPAQEALGKRLSDLFPESVGTKNAEKMYLKALKTQKVQNFVNDFQLGGKDYIFEISAYPSEDGLSVFVKDVTERRKVEEALRESEEKFYKSFYSSPNAMALTTLKEGRFLEVNDGFLRLNDFSREEVIGRNSKELGIWVNPKDRVRILRVMREKGRVVDEEYKSRTKSGEIHTMLFSAEPIEIAGERCMISSATDITERKQAEEKLRDEAIRRRILIDESSDGIVVLDEQGKVYEANKRFAEMLGYSPEEARELSVWDWEFQFPPEQVAEMIRTVDETGDHFETRHRRKDGTTFDVEISTNGAIYAGQKLIFCVCRDITARKQAEAALKESEEKYKTLIEATSDIIWEVDEEGRFTLVGPRIKNVLGYEVAEVVGKKRTLDLIAKGERKKWLKRFKELSVNKEPFFGLEITHLHKNGHHVIFETSGIPLFDSAGEFKGYVGINKDITERRRMQEQLVITDRLASVGELAAGIAHELNNPLTGVIGFSQLLMDKKMPKDIKQDVEVVFNEAQRASQVVKNLLTFARKHAAVKEKVNINDIINKVLELRAYEQNLENITVDARLASELPEVMADYFQLQQVFLNIIINAEYFMKEAHRRGKLTITTEVMDGRIKASFADDGPGIAEDDLGHLFDPFFTTKEVGRGTGLGLSICHGIVAEHGGQIYVESELGKGATFIVELPVGAAERKGGAT